MTGGLEHHWIRLEEGNGRGVKRIGYEVDSEAALAPEVRNGLRRENVDFEEGGDLKRDRVQRWLRFADPGGRGIELYTGMYERGVAPDNNGVKPRSSCMRRGVSRTGSRQQPSIRMCWGSRHLTGSVIARGSSVGRSLSSFARAIAQRETGFQSLLHSGGVVGTTSCAPATMPCGGGYHFAMIFCGMRRRVPSACI